MADARAGGKVPEGDGWRGQRVVGRACLAIVRKGGLRPGSACRQRCLNGQCARHGNDGNSCCTMQPQRSGAFAGARPRGDDVIDEQDMLAAEVAVAGKGILRIAPSFQ